MIIDWFILAHLQLLTTIHHQITKDSSLTPSSWLHSIHGHKPHNVNLLWQHLSLNSWVHNTTFSHVIMHTCIYRWLVTSCCWQQGAHCGNWSWQNQIISNPLHSNIRKMAGPLPTVHILHAGTVDYVFHYWPQQLLTIASELVTAANFCYWQPFITSTSSGPNFLKVTQLHWSWPETPDSMMLGCGFAGGHQKTDNNLFHSLAQFGIIIVACPWSHKFSALFKIFCRCFKFLTQSMWKRILKISQVWLCLALQFLYVLGHMIFLHFFCIFWDFITRINSTKYCQTTLLSLPNSYPQKMLLNDAHIIYFPTNVQTNTNKCKYLLPHHFFHFF